jgi:hypothetical protein
MSLLDETSAANSFLGMCSECLQSKSFPTERARDLWERHHPHDDGDGA